jgi:predicted adenine nucleotide alpha hydrolase (AANH) superfamily ATPase
MVSLYVLLRSGKEIESKMPLEEASLLLKEFEQLCFGNRTRNSFRLVRETQYYQQDYCVQWDAVDVVFVSQAKP